jgi:hypothetical protein
MQSISPNDGLALWFANLRQFQTACNNTSVSKINNLLVLANTTIVTVLPTAAEQNTFITSAGTSTGYDDMAIADLATYKTFEGLLDNWNPLTTAVAVLLQSLAVSSLQGVASADFMSAAVIAAFLGGSAGTPWTDALDSLKSNIPALCFTSAFQGRIEITVDKAGAKMSDLIPQIAVLG